MKRININELTWLVILGGFGLYIGGLIYTGEIIHFINPRMVKYTYFCLMGIVLLWVFQLGRIYNPHNRRIRLGYLLFILPLLLGFILKPGFLDSSIGKNKGVNLSSPGSDRRLTPVEVLRDKLLPFNNGVLEINDGNFLTAMEDMESNRDRYIDKDVVITGFVYKDDGTQRDEFIVARMLMSCCAADSQFIGLLARGSEAQSLKADEWVRVSGKINYIEYKGPFVSDKKTIPVIMIKNVEKIQKPENPYVYP